MKTAQLTLAYLALFFMSAAYFMQGVAHQQTNAAPLPIPKPKPKEDAKVKAYLGKWKYTYGSIQGTITFKDKTASCEFYDEDAEENWTWTSTWVLDKDGKIHLNEEGTCASDSATLPRRLYVLELKEEKGVITGTQTLVQRLAPVLPDFDDERDEQDWDRDYMNKPVEIRLEKE